MLHTLIHKVIPSLTLLVLTACTSLPAPLATLPGSTFSNNNPAIPLTATLLTSGPGPLYLFIEGDGRAYADRTTPSASPTPRTPVALTLAQQTARQNPTATIIYMARPCMWPAPGTNCKDPTLWTTRRFNPNVIATQTSFIQQLVTTYQSNTPLTLIGYSGGATIALHAAAGLKASGTPVRLLTVAGNLDPAATNAFHHVSKQPQWATTPYSALTTIPQKHLIGGADKIIPPQLTETYSQTLGSPCSQPTIIPAATHSTGWEGALTTALTQPFICN